MKQIKNKLIIPGGIRYISDSDYTLTNFNFPHILDKKIPGCGYTEYCLTCNIPIVLCSPRIMLIENKVAQHGDDIFYFKNEYSTEIDTGKDLTKITRASQKEEEFDKDKYKEMLDNLYINLGNYITKCYVNHRYPKIIVTYDSFRLVKDYLVRHNLINNFHVVIDEFQSIFTDSRFKSTTEMEFVYQIQDIQKLCFVSATPMIDKYIQQIDEFKNLPYYEFDWTSEDPFRAIKPDLKIRKCKSVQSAAKEIIDEYKSGKFNELIFTDNSNNIQSIKSTEAVFYVNSVSNIISIIKNNNLRPEECNILCSNTPYNATRIKNRLGKDFKIGNIPLKGQPHKMFTFCTRTVYLGADFYSTCARSFILSDANIDTLAVDISLDLPQILGRQRLPENPWKNRAEFYYKSITDKNYESSEDFDKYIQEKLKRTENLLRSYTSAPNDAKHDLASTYQYVAKSANYRDNYVAVNTHAGKDLVPVLNNLIVIAEQRAFDIQQIDYKDRFTVFNTICGNGLVDYSTSNNIFQFLSEFNNDCENNYEKMRLLCEYELTENEVSVILDQIPIQFKTYYQALGKERCRSLSYSFTRMDKAISDLQFDISKLQEEIYKLFKLNERYTKSDIKQTLSSLYSSLGYNKTPKANDLEEYFELKVCQIINKETGKKDNGFEILSKKD